MVEETSFLASLCCPIGKKSFSKVKATSEAQHCLFPTSSPRVSVAQGQGHGSPHPIAMAILVKGLHAPSPQLSPQFPQLGQEQIELGLHTGVLGPRTAGAEGALGSGLQ